MRRLVLDAIADALASNARFLSRLRVWNTCAFLLTADVCQAARLSRLHPLRESSYAIRESFYGFPRFDPLDASNGFLEVELPDLPAFAGSAELLPLP